MGNTLIVFAGVCTYRQLRPCQTTAAYITDTQVAEASSGVKALAELLAGKDAAKNHYQGMFGELYRGFEVASYLWAYSQRKPQNASLVCVHILWPRWAGGCDCC